MYATSDITKIKLGRPGGIQGDITMSKLGRLGDIIKS